MRAAFVLYMAGIYCSTFGALAELGRRLEEQSWAPGSQILLQQLRAFLLRCCLPRQRVQLRAVSKDLGTQSIFGLWAQSCFQRS